MAQENDKTTGGQQPSGQHERTPSGGQTGGHLGNNQSPSETDQQKSDLGTNEAGFDSRTEGFDSQTSGFDSRAENKSTQQENDNGGFPSGTGHTGSGNLDSGSLDTAQDVDNRTTGSTPGTAGFDTQGTGGRSGTLNEGSEYGSEGDARRSGVGSGQGDKGRTNEDDDQKNRSSLQQTPKKDHNPGGL